MDATPEEILKLRRDIARKHERAYLMDTDVPLRQSIENAIDEFCTKLSMLDKDAADVV